MRKRAQRKGKPIGKPKHIVQKKRPIYEEKSRVTTKKYWVAVALISIFFLVLFFSTFFNLTSGTTFNPDGEGLNKYYLSGPDPYYNMRIVDETLYGENKGHYQFFSEKDPLLNYPLGTTGGRRPLLNMFAIGFSGFLSPFMDEMDAVGYSMQFIPALFGALLVFPVFFIGKEVFNKKAGLIAALFIALIPIHLGSGHGSAFTLFDHDSLNLLLFFLTFFFLIKSIKEKDETKSVLYALLAGVPLAGLSMVWVEAQFLYVLISAYAIVQMIIDIVTSRIEKRVFLAPFITLLFGYLLSLPVLVARIGGFSPDIPLFLCIGVGIFGLIYYGFDKKKIPWTVSLPIIFCTAAVGLIVLYFVNDISQHISFISPLSKLSNILYGSGVYGSKVSLTIAEAHTYDLSRTIMSFGPALFWLGGTGFVLLLYYYYKDIKHRDYLLIISIFAIDIWLTSIAGRFLNDLVPLVAILGGWIVWIIIDKADYKQMIRSIKSAGGGLHGLRKGVSFLHIAGILFVSFLVIIPNGYLALDAAIPFTEKSEAFGDLPNGAFGLSVGKEGYWSEAYNWLNDQDTNITNPAERPAYISWWDYGFYEVAMGGHPTVADNFQDGIPAASNFHTATSEKEAVSILAVRLLEGHYQQNNGFSEETEGVLSKHLGENNSQDVMTWVADPQKSPSYHKPIGAEYDENLSKELIVGEQYSTNAVYQDIANLITNEATGLTDEETTQLYLDLIDATGYSIRYYGVEGYDKQIFNIFGFLADKSLFLPAIQSGYIPEYNPEDDYMQLKIITQNVYSSSTEELTFEELHAKPADYWQTNSPVNRKTYYKDAYFDTMFYRTYIGPADGESGNKQESQYQLPCVDMKHFCAEFISDTFNYSYYQLKGAVVIAKYYAGALLNGNITFNGEPVQAEAVIQKDIHQYGMEIPIDHDKTSTDSNGNFSLIAPAGSYIQIRRYPNYGANMVILKNVTFDSLTDPELAELTDEVAMRTPGTNYEREIAIEIEPGVVEGCTYLNSDGINGYNSSSNDQIISGVKVNLYEIGDYGTTSLSPSASVVSDDDGHYNVSGLMPGLYVVRLEKDSLIIHEDLLKILPGENNYDLAKKGLSSVSGKIYLDSNGNGKFNSGEELSDVDVTLTYKKYNVLNSLDEEIVIGAVKTGQDGAYVFSSLVYGNYEITAIKLPGYSTRENISLLDNETKEYNISIDYVPIVVSGNTMKNQQNFGNVTVIFSKDESMENNVAVTNSIISDLDDGAYSIDLLPGTYNVTAEKEIDGEKYSFEQKLTLSVAQGTRLLDITLVKE